MFPQVKSSPSVSFEEMSPFSQASMAKDIVLPQEWVSMPN